MYPKMELESRFDEEARDRLVPDLFEDFPFHGYNRVLDRIVEVSGARPDETVLELGIGTGTLARRFLESACRVIGLDFSEARLAEAKRKHPGLTLHRVDMRRAWPTIERPIHHVVGAYFLHELTLGGKLLVVRRALDLLPDNGRVLIGDVAFATRSARTAASLRYRDRWDPKQHYWAADEMAQHFARIGIRTTFEALTPCAALLTFERFGDSVRPQRAN